MSDNEYICPICGEPTNKYYGNYRKDRLCYKHGMMANAGEIVQCPDCGEWHNVDEDCECEEECNEMDFEENDADTHCIICGEPSNGYYFCRHCYYRYRNKEILIKIKNCEMPCGEPLDESYEGVYECDDGHIVKSQAERDIDNYLYENQIFHGYEQSLDVGEKKPLKPDFCLKNYLGNNKDVYIEYFGYTDNPQYEERTAYKMPLYKKAGITLICMYAKSDLKNIRFALKTKLNKERIKENEINYLE